MSNSQYRTGVDPTTAERLASAARTGLGDTLRSVVYFTPSAFDVLYVRRDLYESPEAARPAKSRLVEAERSGFAELPLRTRHGRNNERSSIGDYRFTVRFHDEGFVVRILEGDAGVVLTTDSMDVRAFTESTTAMQRVLDA
jgi:hypothetical protein